MDFKVLAVGDVVGNPGVKRVSQSLRKLKRETAADFVVVNGENASMVGITPQQAEDIFDAGAIMPLENGRSWTIWRTTAEFCVLAIMRPRPPAEVMAFTKPTQEMWRSSIW